MDTKKGPGADGTAAEAKQHRVTPKHKPSAAEAQITEDALALAFAERNEGRLAFVEELTCRVAQRWHVRDGDDWTPDKTLSVPWLIRKLVGEFRGSTDDPETILRLGSRATFVAVELLARSDPRLVRSKAELGIKPRTRRQT